MGSQGGKVAGGPPGDPWSPDAARPHVEADFGPRLDVCRELLAESRDRIEPWSGRPLATAPHVTADDLVGAELARSTTTYSAAIELCSMGFGVQAAMLNRSLFEGMAIAHWVHANESEATDVFLRAHQFERHLTVGVLEQVGWEDQAEPGVLEDARLGDEEAKLLEREFGSWGSRLWTGRNLHDLVTSIEDQWQEGFPRSQLWQFFRVVHRDNNQMLHSSISALSATVTGVDAAGRHHVIGPSNAHLTQSLFAAHWCYANLFTLIFDRFGLRDRAPYDEMLARHQFDFFRNQPEHFRDVGRNDPCPCGSGRKFKRCHLNKVSSNR